MFLSKGPAVAAEMVAGAGFGGGGTGGGAFDPFGLASPFSLVIL